MGLHLLFLGVGPSRKLHILRDIDQHGARTPGCRDVECLVQDLCKIVRVFHKPIMFRAGACDPNGIRLLERICADHKGRDLTRQNEDRDTVHQRICQASHCVCRTGT